MANAEWRLDLDTMVWTLIEGYSARHAHPYATAAVTGTTYAPLHGVGLAPVAQCFMGCGPADYWASDAFTGHAVTVCCDCARVSEDYGSTISEL